MCAPIGIDAEKPYEIAPAIPSPLTPQCPVCGAKPRWHRTAPTPGRNTVMWWLCVGHDCEKPS